MAGIHRYGPARARYAGAAATLLLAASGVAAQAAHSHSHSHSHAQEHKPGHRQAHAHRHGTGTLDLSVDGGSMTVQLVLPLIDVVGFERAPATDAERARVAAAGARLRDPDALFAVSPEAGCRLRSARVDLDAVATGTARSSPDDAGHGDARADYAFDCARPDRARRLDVRVFDVFPAIASLQVQVATAQAQRGARVTAAQRRMSW